jgi:hypothetical protein
MIVVRRSLLVSISLETVQSWARYDNASREAATSPRPAEVQAAVAYKVKYFPEFPVEKGS